MVFVARLAKEVLQPGELQDNAHERQLSELQTIPAWILLGEPGSGKSQAFKSEADACQGVYRTIADFLSDELDDRWIGKTLFLDGLDEIRASATDTTILGKVRSRLRKLGQPNFRIACRAADWYGQSDQADLLSVSPNGLLPIFQLSPLGEQDISTILERNFEIAEPNQFVAMANAHGIHALLNNPQTLKLLAQAIKGNDWPDTRNQTFELACLSQVKEQNKRHRDRTRGNMIAPPLLLDAAGQLFCVVLLSDKSGISLDAGCANDRFPSLEDLAPSDPIAAPAAVHTSLFVPSTTNEERLEPSHRSIAEYLAAQWLAKQIDITGLAASRALNLMLGLDGKTVASLRGLYGWLALHSKSARTQLIHLDPLTVVQYGDVQTMPIQDKRLLLSTLYRDTQSSPAHLWSARDAGTLGALYDEAIAPEFLQTLESSKRDEATQTYVVFLLNVLNQAHPEKQVLKILRSVAADDSRWSRARTQALKIWLDQDASPSNALEFLNAINAGVINDPDDELTGLLLEHLYPSTIAAQDLLKHLHIPKNKNLLGAYTRFWAYHLPEVAPENDLPTLLDQLHSKTDLPFDDRSEFHLSRMAATLVVKGIAVHGDAISDDRLFQWLTIGSDQYGENRRDQEHRTAISDWISARPERYKGLLAVCYRQAAINSSPQHSLFSKVQVLSGVTPPNDIGLWHLRHVNTESNEILAKEHLSQAMRALMYEQGNAGLTLDMVCEWADNDPVHLEWLKPELSWEIPNWRTQQAQVQLQYKEEQNTFRRNRTIQLTERMDEIKRGQASPALLFELAGVWLKRYTNTPGDGPMERFKSYCDNYEEVYAAAQNGFKLCVERDDLPDVGDIVSLSLQQKEHFIRRPCLLGMELRWEESTNAVDSLSSQTLERMACFRLADGTGETPEWFIHLVKSEPNLIAHVLIEYASKQFKAKRDYVDGIYPLAQNGDYAEVARIAVPKLLETFPLRAKASQLHQLECLLKSMTRYSMPELGVLLEQKTAMKTMDVPQKVYWLTAAMLADPLQYEAKLWSYIGESWQRAQHMANFLGSRHSDLQQDVSLSAYTLARLIEIQTPHAELDWPKGGGLISEAMRFGDQVRGLISKLVVLGTEDSAKQIERLLLVPSLRQIRSNLDSARHELQQRIREKAFSFPSLTVVAQTLANQPPTSASDLCALVVDHLDELAKDMRVSNSDPFRQFWNEGINRKHKDENSCRDALLHMLRHPLRSFGLECMPEADYFNDKRADIRISYKNEIELPIEIKGEWNPTLWTAINDQLVTQYVNAKNAAGYGVYLVLWFGGELQATPRDGGKKPKTRAELELRLNEIVPTQLWNHIHVRVIDVSWPS